MSYNLELTEIRSEPHSAGAFVPDYCRARLTGRILPGESRQSVLEQITHALADLPDLELSLASLEQTCYTGTVLRMDDFIPPWRNDPRDPWQERILSKMGDVKTFGAGFGTNASAAAARGITSFIYGPGSLEKAHAMDEWLDVEQFLKAVDGYTSIALSCLSKH